MTSIFKTTHGEMNEFVGRLSRAGLTAELLRMVNEDATLADRMVGVLGNIEFNPGFFLAGYELFVPESGDEPWDLVPLINRYLGTGVVNLPADWYSYANSAYAVPVCRE